jgi:hypothetical protein
MPEADRFDTRALSSAMKRQATSPRQRHFFGGGGGGEEELEWLCVDECEIA